MRARVNNGSFPLLATERQLHSAGLAGVKKEPGSPLSIMYRIGYVRTTSSPVVTVCLSLVLWGWSDVVDGEMTTGGMTAAPQRDLLQLELFISISIHISIGSIIAFTAPSPFVAVHTSQSVG